MTETLFYHRFLLGWSLLALLVFAALFFITAPYGRFTRGGWGPTLSSRLGWMLMEAPSAVLMVVFFFMGDRIVNPVAWVFLLIWESHYLHRAFVYPFQLRGGRKRMTVVTVLMAIVFNTGNCYLNGRYLFTLSSPPEIGWLADPRFIIGLVLFVLGYRVNKRSDAVLRSLRREGEGGGEYGIPRGGLFERVSCANYLGELVLWCGWAVLTWSPGGVVFVLWTAANLVPRARSIHRWYQQTFPDYPKNRKAMIPFVF